MTAGDTSAGVARGEQPATFAFNAENLERARRIIARYPAGRQASAVLPLLDIAQRQHRNWLPRAAMDYVAGLLDMPPIRVYEVATFYSMFNLEPVGAWFFQICTTTPCWLRGSDQVVQGLREQARHPCRREHCRRQVHAEGSRMPRCVRQRADHPGQRRFLRGSRRPFDREADRRAERRPCAADGLGEGPPEIRARGRAAGPEDRAAALRVDARAAAGPGNAGSRQRRLRQGTCCRTRTASSPTSTGSRDRT
jgi:NADH:ubiquinone oxidoreductase subunit E